MSHDEMRKVFIHSPQPNSIKFCTNSIKTAKYNILTFLPVALIYQFNNYFNIFFLFTAIILSIKVISPLDPGTAIGPFVFVIMTGVIIEGVEDLKKAKYDKTYNNLTTKAIDKDNKEQSVKWSDVTVGSVLKISKNEIIPADLLIVASSSSNGFCYMQTTNLDGESALKPREVMPAFHLFPLVNSERSEINLDTITGGLIEVDQPNCNIYNINGSVSLTKPDQAPIKAFFTIDNIVLRGTTLKNVDHIHGIVIYTGKDTKIMKNINPSSLKSSSIEKTLNKIVLVVIAIVMSMCVVLTMFGMIFMSSSMPEEDNRNAEYIFYARSNDFSYTLEFFQLFGSYFIIFNNIIPISLAITFTIAKIIQILIIEADKKFKQNPGDQFKILSMRLQEDLGNVRYIFTDKTGTLTRNEMIFKGCSVYGKIFYEDSKDSEGLEQDPEEEKKIIRLVKEGLFSELPLDVYDPNNSLFKSSSDTVKEFFLNMVLNHNVLTEYDNEKQVKVFQGTNPDEVALVSLAKEVGLEFLDRTANQIRISIHGIEYVYELLYKFEFSSERARSAVIVRDSIDNLVKLFIKGSDDKIFKLIDEFSKANLATITKEHVDNFAKEGLRTLCYGVKTIPEVDFLEWEHDYKEMKYLTLQDKTKLPLLDEVINKIEKGCVLLGVSALEDKLQDEVKDDIAKFIEAGIQTWMITGDKLDTAESIGYSSKFFDDDTEVFKIRNNSQAKDILENMKKILEEMAELEEKLMKYKLERKKRKNKTKKPIKEQLSIGPSVKNNTERFKLKNKTIGINKQKSLPIKKENPTENASQNSQVDDVSVIKFMLDKNFFESSLNKNQTNTFVNKIMQLARNVSKESFEKGQIININIKNNVITSKEDKNDKLPEKEANNHQPENSINLSSNNELDNIDGDSNTEAVNISNLYNYYKSELDKIKERKQSVRNILKYTNLDFQNYRRKKKESEVHEVKELNLLNFGLVIEGNALNHCLDEEIQATFWELIKKSRSIICCRCTPIQKSNIVNFVKRKSGEVCLAIGDGGNDVNMIKAANVGVGIFGKEGYQAAYNSDYAISQFKYLKHLLFYHGRYILLRNSYFIYFFFYKSIIFNVANLWFSFFSAFSGTLLWDELYFTLYTSLLTTMPPVVFMVYGEDIDMNFEGYPDVEICKSLIPDIYREFRESSPFNYLKFFIVFILGCLHSAILYLFPLFVFRFNAEDRFGRPHSFWSMSLQGTLNALIVQYYILFQDTFMFSKEVIIPHTVQIVHNIIFFGLYSGFGSDELGAFTFDIVSSIQFWFTLLITLAIALVPVIISRKFDILLNDNIINNLRNRRYEADFTKKMYIKKIEHMMKCTRNLARFKKIYNALDKFEADNFADRKMKDIVDLYRNLKNRKITRDKNSNKKIRQAGQRLKKPKSQSLDQKVKTLNIQIVKGNTIGKRMSNEDIKILVDGAIKNSEVSSSGELNIKIPDDVVVNFDIENECEVVDDINTRVFDSPYQVESNRESEICLENKETVLNIDTDTAIIAANKEKEDKKESDSVRNN